MNLQKEVYTTAILIPAGTYLLKSGIEIQDSIVLRGEGADKTHLFFDLDDQNVEAAIWIGKYDRGDWVRLIDGYVKDSKTIRVMDPASFNVGSYAQIRQDNNPRIHYTKPEWDVEWAEGMVGQIVKIVAVEGNTITLEEPLRYDYQTEWNPVIRSAGSVVNAGIERLHIKRLDSGGGNIIYLKHTAYSWIKEVESEFSYNSHVEVQLSYRCEIRDSYFHDAYKYNYDSLNVNDGGVGYGIDLMWQSTGCLVENNIFSHLRHSVLVQFGSTGNVIGYNYSHDTILDDGYPICDLSIHGHYPSYNLFESNIFQEIGISDYWGPVGPGNVYFRNSIQSRDIFLQDHSDSQFIIGNELARGELRQDSTITKITAYANLIRGKLVSLTQVHDPTLPQSYYYLSKPFFYGAMPWPSLGADMPGGTIPALERYTEGNYLP